MIEKRWNVLPSPPQSFIDDHPELPKIVSSLLYNRGIMTAEEIDSFLQPDYSKDVHDPFLFKDMEVAVRRLFTAVEKDEHITIHGDYDADGVSAAVILTEVLEAIGAKHIDVYLPHREKDGYGLNNNTIDYLADKGTNLIITCDCGISNATEIAYANEKGIDSIITDHHTVPENVPKAHAIIHPKVPDEPYPDKELAGGGVAFKLAQGLIHTHHKSHETLANGISHEGFEKWLLDMVAIASVADMVPLLGESRTLTKYGLIVLNKTRRIGLQKLFLESGIMDNDMVLKKPIDANTIGFRIAPQINAAGRIDHANVAYKLLTAKYGSDAIDLAFRLHENNKERREITENYVKQAIDNVEKHQLDNPVLFYYNPDWTTGIVGLIASRIKARYQKPTIIMANNGDVVTGSGRSVPGFDMIDSLQEMPEYFDKFGGHPMACGFSLADSSKIKEFQEAFIKKCSKKTKDIDMTPTLDIDAEIDLADVDWKLYDSLDKFKPFGQKNPAPKYVARGVTITELKPLGKEKKHLRILVTHNNNVIRKTIGWNLCTTDGEEKNWCKLLHVGDTIDIVFEIGINEWNGNRELQLTIVDIKQV